MLLERIRRMGRSHGHGVHSPFAFRFIVDVIGERNLYYAYDLLDNLARNRRELRVSRLLHRITVFFHPRQMAVVGRVSECEMEALQLADTRVEVKRYDSDTATAPFLVVGNGVENKIEAKADVVVVLDGRHWEYLVADMAYGMTFTDGKTGIIVYDPRLPLSHFNINFR